jgi:hypothetical protein
VHEGKATIQLKLPSCLIFIENANPNALQNFLTAISRINKDPDYGND